MSDWKAVPKIDAHIHLVPPDVIAANQGRICRGNALRMLDG